MDRHHHGTDGGLHDHYPNHNDVNDPASHTGGHSCADHDHPRSTRTHGSTDEHHDELIDEFVDHHHDCSTNDDDNRCPNDDNNDYNNNDYDHHHDASRVDNNNSGCYDHDKPLVAVVCRVARLSVRGHGHL